MWCIYLSKTWVQFGESIILNWVTNLEGLHFVLNFETAQRTKKYQTVHCCNDEKSTPVERQRMKIISNK